MANVTIWYSYGMNKSKRESKDGSSAIKPHHLAKLVVRPIAKRMNRDRRELADHGNRVLKKLCAIEKLLGPILWKLANGHSDTMR